jgi:hypothetical protein
MVILYRLELNLTSSKNHKTNLLYLSIHNKNNMMGEESKKDSSSTGIYKNKTSGWIC